MIKTRLSHERGHAQHGWLDSHHTFSFANYYDPAFMGFGPLRVINEDRVLAGRGFGTHPHRNMEIISYVLSGALEHKDSMGTGSVIRPGDVQLMSAGRGVSHSEYNASSVEPVHFLQIWISPSTQNTEPNYQQVHFEPAERQDQWRLLASPNADDEALTLLQDAMLFGTLLSSSSTLSYQPAPTQRQLWLHVVRGQVILNGHVTLNGGDAAGLLDEPSFELEATEDAEVLLFDMANVDG